MLSFVIVDLSAMPECTFVHVDGYLRGQGGVCYYRDTIHRGSPETSGNIAIVAQTWGDKTISPQRGITSLNLTLK